MNFSQPTHLYALFALPILAVILIIAARRRRKRLHAFSEFAEKVALVGQYRPDRVFYSIVLMLLAYTFLVIAWAGPRLGFTWEEVQQSGLDIMVVVDVSESMLASDIKPNRLERAKREVYDLIGELRGDRVGIIAFAGVAFVQCPLTIDYGAARNFLSYLRTDLIPVQGSSLDEALELAKKSLSDSGEAAKGERIVILISDGEDHSQKALDLADQFKEAGIKIYAIGLGDPTGAPVPDLANGGFKHDDSGQIVLSKLNEGLLKSLAERTGGQYRQSSAAGFSLQTNLFADLGLEKDGKMESRRQKRWHERFQWFLVLAFLCLVTEWFMRDYERNV